MRPEDHARHRQPGRQALLRPGELDGDPVRPAESELPCPVPAQGEHQRQQDRLGGEQRPEPGGGDLVPDAGDHPLAERGVDDEQDRPPVDQTEHLLVPGEETADPAAQELSGQERDEQLEHDLQQGVHGEPAPGGPEEQGGEQRGQQDPGEAGEGTGADRGGHIAPGDRGEGDGGLDRGRDQAQEEEARLELGRQHVRHQPAARQPQQREDDEGAGQDGEVEAPVLEPVERLGRREPRPVEEEQQGDGAGGGSARHVGGGAAGGQQCRERHGGGQRQEVGVERQPGRQARDTAGHVRGRSGGRGFRFGVHPAPGRRHRESRTPL